MSVADYKITIGLETHVQLATKTKIWCGCPARYGDEPNTLVCPVCMGYPGALPVLNEEAVRFTVLSGMLLGCRSIGAVSTIGKAIFTPICLRIIRSPNTTSPCV